MLRAAALSIVPVLLSIPAFADAVLFNGSIYDYDMGGLAQRSPLRTFHDAVPQARPADGRIPAPPVEVAIAAAPLSDDSRVLGPLRSVPNPWAYMPPVTFSPTSPNQFSFASRAAGESELGYAVRSFPQSIEWHEVQPFVELPEPGSMALLAAGIAALAVRRRRRRA